MHGYAGRMARLHGLTPAEARRFRTGRMALDLLHTGGDGPHSRWELLRGPAELGRWLTVVTGLDDIAATALDIDPVFALRRSLRRTAERAMKGAPASIVDRLAINAAAAVAPPVPELRAGGGTAVRGPVPVPEVLSLLARDAIDLFGGPLAGRIRVCAAADCDLLYVDQSPAGNRQWCSMQRCGTLTKVRAYRRRAA